MEINTVYSIHTWNHHPLIFYQSYVEIKETHICRCFFTLLLRMTFLSYSRFQLTPVHPWKTKHHRPGILCPPMHQENRRKTEGFNSSWLRKLSTTISLLIKPSAKHIPANWGEVLLHSKVFTQKKKTTTNHHPFNHAIQRSLGSVVPSPASWDDASLGEVGQPAATSLIHRDFGFIHRKCGRIPWISYMCHVM